MKIFLKNINQINGITKNFEARYYANGIWRFRSLDRVFWEIWESKNWVTSLYIPQLQNSYSYVWNNPIKYTDKSWEYIDVLVDWGVASIWYWYWYATDDKLMMQVWEEMLKDTLKWALNPVKKIKKVKKGFDDVKKGVDKMKKWFFKDTNYTNKVKNDMKKDKYHGFPKIIDKQAEKSWKIENFKWWDWKTYQKLSIPWTLNWKQWKYEYIKDNKWNINHRLFNDKYKK